MSVNRNSFVIRVQRWSVR